MEKNTTKEKMHSICVGDFGIVGNTVFLSNGNFNALIQVDLQTNRIISIEKFPDFKDGEFAIHRICKVVGNEVWFFQETGNVISVYDTLNKRHHSVVINYEMSDGKPYGTQFVYEDDGNLYLFSAYTNRGLVKLNTDTKTCSIEDWWHIQNEKNEDILVRSDYFATGCVWSQSLTNNIIYITDISKKRIDAYRVDLDGNDMHMCEYDGVNFWIAVKNDPTIYKWNPKDGIKDRIRPDIEVGKDGYSYKIFSCQDNKVFVFLRNPERNEIYVLDENRESLKSIGVFPDWVLYPDVQWTVYAKQYRRKVYFFCYYTNLIIEVNLDDLVVKFLSTTIYNEKQFDDYIFEMMEGYKKEIVKEEKSYDFRTGLSSFIDIVTDNY